MRAKEIPLEIVRQPKTFKNVTFTYNPNNPIVFPIIKQTFSVLKQCPTLLRGRNLSNLWAKHPILVGYSVGLKHKNHEKKNCRKNCVSCSYLLKASLYQFKRVKKTFLLKNSFNCESSNLIYVVICQGCKEEYIGETGCLVKERINIYRQHMR